MARPVQLNKAQVEVWRPLTLRNVEHNPKTFYSKKELVRYCKKNKISSSALL